MVFDHSDGRRIRLEDRLTLAEHGYKVQLLDSGFGPVKGSWILLDPDGACIGIGGEGCVASAEWKAVAEGLRRIAEDCRECEGNGELEQGIRQDSFGNWDTDTFTCAACAGTGRIIEEAA